MDVAGIVAACTFALGLAYALGIMHARVDHLETWRAEIVDDIKAIRSTTDEINGALRNERTDRNGRRGDVG